MEINPDYLTKEDVENIFIISKNKKLFLYQIGQMCGIRDKGFWSRIMSGKKPIPAHARKSLTYLIESKETNNDKGAELCK